MSQALNADLEYRISCQKYLESLIAQRDFRAAARYYDSIAESLSGCTDVTSGVIMRLGAKAFGSSGELTRALTLIRTAISILTPITGETTQLASGYLDLGDILREMGNMNEAEKAFRDAESIFRRNDNYTQAGDALNRLAGILFRKGDFDAALKCLIEAIEHTDKKRDNKKLAYLYGNVGRVYTLLGKLNKARKNIQFNIDLSSELNDELELARAYLSLGYVHIQMHQFEPAEQALANAIELIKDNNFEKEEIIYLTYSGELLLKMGQLDGAEWMLKEASSRAARDYPDSLLAARPLRHLADLYTAREQYRKALRISNQALTMMNENDAVEEGAIYRIQAVCHSRLKDEDKALGMFEKAVATLEECRARFELADLLAAAGQSGLYASRQSLMYLCRAEEIYNQCGIKTQATRIQKLIGQTTVALDSEKDIMPISPNGTPACFPTRNVRMKEIADQLGLINNTDLPILLTGETGTGKDFTARYFHAMMRPENKYVAINCAAVPDSLIESELFGYQRGAFTGADTNREGLFMAANGGVLLLDEIGEMPLALQAKLLAVLESRRFRPLGTSKEVELDIFLLAATNRDLNEMVERGTFRRDLYYRLAGMTFNLPPLRERKEDIPYLLETFMCRFGLLDKGQKPEADLISLFVSHDWPGNIRQLENKVKQLSVMTSLAKDGSVLELSRPFFEQEKDSKANSLFEQVEQFEKRLLLEALVSANGNKSEAARILSIHESTFRAKMKKYGLEFATN